MVGFIVRPFEWDLGQIACAGAVIVMLTGCVDTRKELRNMMWPALITLGAALPEEHLPKPGWEPRAFLIVCSSVPEDRVVDMDLGFAAQSILLKAVEMGLGGLFILNIRKEALRQALDLPLSPLAVIAIGKPAERVFLLPISGPDEDLAYYRKDGNHYVPKLQGESLLV